MCHGRLWGLSLESFPRPLPLPSEGTVSEAHSSGHCGLDQGVTSTLESVTCSEMLPSLCRPLSHRTCGLGGEGGQVLLSTLGSDGERGTRGHRADSLLEKKETKTKLKINQ